MRHRLRHWVPATIVAAALCQTVIPAWSCFSEKPLTVAIDVGHSASKAGAKSARGKEEFAFNLRFAEELIQRSTSWPNLKLLLLGESDRQSLIGRVRAAGRIGAQVFVSIHHDSVNDKYLQSWIFNGKTLAYADGFRGYSIFISKQGARVRSSLALATRLGERLRANNLTPTLHHAEKIRGESRELLQPELGIYEAPFLVLTKNKMAAILFEVGVIVNRAEEVDLESKNYRAKLQTSLLDALDSYCRDRSGKSVP